MTISQIIGDMIKVGAISFIWNKSLTAFGKKDFGQIIGASGLACVGIDVIKLIKKWQDNSPPIIKIIKAICKINDKIMEGNNKVNILLEKGDEVIRKGFNIFIDK